MRILANAYDLPNYTFFLVLAMVLVGFRLATPFEGTVPRVLLGVGMIAWAISAHWLIASLFLRSDPRIWREGTRWYQANLAPLKLTERDLAVRAVHDAMASRLRIEMIVIAAVGAAMAAIGTSAVGIAIAALVGAMIGAACAAMAVNYPNTR